MSGREAVARYLRLAGCTYQEIGAALHVSRQRAHQLVNERYEHVPALIAGLRIHRESCER